MAQKPSFFDDLAQGFEIRELLLQTYYELAQALPEDLSLISLEGLEMALKDATDKVTGTFDVIKEDIALWKERQITMSLRLDSAKRGDISILNTSYSLHHLSSLYQNYFLIGEIIPVKLEKIQPALALTSEGPLFLEATKNVLTLLKTLSMMINDLEGLVKVYEFIAQNGRNDEIDNYLKVHLAGLSRA